MIQIKESNIWSGELAEISLVEVLGAIFATRKTGGLSITYGRQETIIYFCEGIPINADSTGSTDELLEVMVADQRLSAEDVLQVKQFAEDRKVDAAKCLMDLFEVPLKQVYYYQARAATRIIVKACGMKQGTYRFREGETEIQEVEAYDLNPMEIIYESIEKHHSTDLPPRIYEIERERVVINPDQSKNFLLPEPILEHSEVLDIFEEEVRVGHALAAMQKAFGDVNIAVLLLYILLITDKVVSAEKTDIEEEVEEIEVGPKSNRHEAVDEPPSSEVLSTDYVITRPGRDKVETGKLTEKAPSDDTRPEDLGTEEEETSTFRMPSRSDFGRDEVVTESEEQEEKAAESHEKGEVEKEEEEEKSSFEDFEELRRFQAALTALSQVIENANDYYDMLGVSVKSTINEIQDAYDLKTRKIATEQLSGNAPEELLEEAYELREKLEEAMNALIDPDRRYQYEMSILEKEKKRSWKLETKKKLAMKMERRGHWYLANGATKYAKSFFEEAIDLDPEQAEFYMDLGWAIFRDNPLKASEAAEYIGKAIEVAPDLDKAYYYLGIIHKRRENIEKAIHCFNKALSLNPKNASARRELDFVNQKEKEKGLLAKIFGPK